MGSPEGAVKKNVSGLRTLAAKQGGTFSKLNAPNVYSAVEFDDFILFTRVVKQLAQGLCQSARPTDEEIVKMIMRHNETGTHDISFRKLIGRNHTPARLRRALAGVLRTLYSLEINEASPIPSHRVRGFTA
jgi:hypothetical protein